MADLQASVGRHEALTPPDGAALARRLRGGPGVKGVDCVGGCPPAALVDGGWRFICRYLSWPPNGKNLINSRPPYGGELAGYLAAGVQVVANWEATGHPGNGFGTGAADAREAQRQLDLMGAGTPPVYFSIDYDAQPADQPLIDSYFAGVASVLGLARVGGYGGYYVIKRLLDGGKITWAWQCQAWSHGLIDPRIHLLQLNNAGYVTVGGTQCDVDQAWQADFGAMPRSAPAPSAPPAPTPLEDDVGTPNDNATTLLMTLLPDPYDTTGRHKMNVSDTLANGTAFAAHARDEATAAHQAADAAVAQLAGLQAAVSHLADAVSGAQGVDPAVIKAAIKDAIAEAIASSVTVTGSLAVVPAAPAPPPVATP